VPIGERPDAAIRATPANAEAEAEAERVRGVNGVDAGNVTASDDVADEGLVRGSDSVEAETVAEAPECVDVDTGGLAPGVDAADGVSGAAEGVRVAEIGEAGGSSGAIELGARLAVRVRAGDDPVAMQELLRFLEPYVGRWCGSIALQDGPDAMQETLLIVFRSLHQLKEPAALLGWVRAIAVREAVKIAAKANRSFAAELAEVPSRAEIETVSDVRDVLRRLSPEHRAILVLRDLEDLDERSVAEILDVSVGTVKSRLSRARRNFRRSWS
jgi:RNA polymerase sigma-70 factor (ECF subfamily)